MYNISKKFVTMFGVGFFPIAPGTIGTFITFAFYFVIFNYLTLINILTIFIFSFILAIILIHYYSKYLNKYDSSEIIIDEFLGSTLIILSYKYYDFSNSIILFIIGALIFRFFDIVKIFPSNYIDKNIKNSFGVIMDDIVAGIYTIIIIYIINVRIY